MTATLRLANPAARVFTIAAVLMVCCGLLYAVVRDYLIEALTDDRILVTADAAASDFLAAPFVDRRIGVAPGVLETAARYLSNSPRLHMRLADFERYRGKNYWEEAELHAARAVGLSPRDYKPLLLLASIQDSRDDLQAAEESVRSALRLAPNNVDAHWELGTLLLRRKKLPESLKEFRLAAGSPDYLRPALKLVWTESNENPAAVRAITPDSSEDLLALANFLLEQSRPLESADVFRQISGTLSDDREAGQYLDKLIAAGHFALAHELWRRLAIDAARASRVSSNPVWNGGFESEILVDLAQFDWSIRPCNYARVAVDGTIFHGGSRALRVDFLGRDTTRLDDEISHLVILRPGQRYRLKYYIKTRGLITPQGPRVVLSDRKSRQLVAASDPVPAGSNEWRLHVLEFKAAQAAVLIAIRQTPSFSYEDPTQGAVWFDDFEIEAMT
jgi:Tfp pilus assembly protein PilF